MESLNVAPDLTPAQGANDEELAKRGEAAVQAGNTHKEDNPATEAKSRPEWVPEKFWNPETGEVDTEGMAKSYKELEKLRGQPEKKPEGQVKLETVEDAQALAVSKNLDFNALSEEYRTKGDLSDETYKSLEDRGISKEVVKQFVEGQKAQLEQNRAEVLKEIGGEESFAEMSAWAQSNLTQQELAAYNKAVQIQDIDIMKMAVRSLQQRYQQANGQPPKTQLGGRRGAATAEPFESRTQYVDAVKDPRYDRDAAYRNQVLKRLEVSNIF